MIDYVFFVGIFILLGIASLYIGYKTARSVAHQTSFYLGDRKVNLFSLMLTFLATQLGGGAIIGSAEAAYTHGWVAIFYVLGLSLGLIFLSLGIGKRFYKLHIVTVAEIFTAVYQSPWLRQVAALFSIITLFLILLAIGVSARKFFMAIGLGHPFVFFSFWGIAIAYTVMGGLKAVIKTDVLQMLFIIFTFLLTFLCLDFSNFAPTTPLDVVKDNTSFPWLRWLLVPLFFVLIGQDMGQRCFVAQSPRIVTWATALAGILLILCSLLPIYIGIIGAKFGIALPGEGSILMKIVGQLVTPQVAACFACALLMAILSTADSLLCAISSNVALDFKIMDLFAPKWRIRIAQLITLVIGIVSIVLSYFEGDIIPIMLTACEWSIAILWVPIIMAIWIKNPCKKAALTAMCIGLMSILIAKCLVTSLPMEVLSIGLSLAGYGIIYGVKKRCHQKISQDDDNKPCK